MALWCEIVAVVGALSGWIEPLVGWLIASGEESLVARIVSLFYVWGSVALGLGVVIFVHELGHFLAAKLFGVKVEKFYVGFDVPISLGPIKFPRTLGKFRYGETEYGIGIIPLGGYVKMLGQDDDPRNLQKENERIRQAAEEAGEEVDEPIETAAPQLDPRSYPAKTVGQRMVIISAGVVMNIVTGVLFAAFAYGALGVDYTPAVIGAVSPGDPAWAAGIEPGGKVVSVDGDPVDGKLHFSRMMLRILTHGIATPEEPVKVKVEYPDGVQDFQLMTASDPSFPERRIIGVTSPRLAQLGANDQYALEGFPAAEVLTAEDAGAEILAVNGVDLEPNELLGVTLEDAVARELLERPDQPVTLKLRRADEAKTIHEVTIPPRKMLGFGAKFGIGPVETLVASGPAAQAGIEVGDVITGIEGIETLTAFGLPIDLQQVAGPTRVTVRRGTGEAAEELTFSVTPQTSNATLPPHESPTGKIALNRLGLAYYPTTTVVQSSVDALQVGDRVTSVTVNWPQGGRPELLDEPPYEKLTERLEEGWDFSERPMRASLVRLLQLVPQGTELRVIAERGADNRVIDTTAKLTESDTYWQIRGVGFAPVRFTQQADSFGEAMALGYREGKWKLGEVLHFLKLIFTGRVGRQHVGGPLAIADMAASQAEQGWAPLLLFLTLISMNLAILNFLPIPALDGGHMVFLIAEAVMGRPINEELQMKLTMAGVLLVLSLMIFVFANDILRWV